MLIRQTLFGEQNMIETAIERLKFAYEVAQSRNLGPLYVCFSGGKDSIVIAHLAKMSGVPYELHHNITGIDPPELIRFMRKHYPDLIWHRPRKTMWELIERKGMPPTRLMRYCCYELKEHGGRGRVCVTGVRWAESVRRKKTRKEFEIKTADIKKKVVFNDNDEGRTSLENCVVKGSVIANPIVDWTDGEVWQFIRQYNLPYCKLYDQGETRIGCIGCPMQGSHGMAKKFARYPKYKALYIRAFDKMLKARIIAGKPTQWKTAEEVMTWWLGGGCERELPMFTKEYQTKLEEN